MSSTTRLAIFASGQGSNAAAIYRSFKNHSDIEVTLLVCNDSRAKVLQQASNWYVDVFLLKNKALSAQPTLLLQTLRKYRIDFIALTGFLRLLPEEVVSAYRGRIFNIHPSLLPKYGGRGMYGLRVHEAVLRNAERESGITIHEVNEVYDEGKIIFSKALSISYDRPPTPNQLSTRIKALEHKHYPRILAEEIQKRRKHLSTHLA